VTFATIPRMLGVRRARLGWHALALAFMAGTHAQTAGLIADLGDPQLGEAAERALLEFGDGACGPLETLFAAWNVATPRDVARLRAALRVVDLLGEPAAPLATTLVQRLPAVGPQLRIETFTALGSLAPYAVVDQKQIPLDGMMIDIAPGEQAKLFTSIVRLAARSGERDRVVQLAILQNKIFVREIAAERIADEAAIESLRTRLLERNRPAAGWDQVRHNGVLVPIEDGFRFRAASALVQLVPDDPRSIVGHGCLALLHPHRTARRESLRALVRFGPAIAEALPELLQIAQQGDAELAGEALKLMSLAEHAVGPHLAEIQALQAHAEGIVAKLAAGLAARLQSMGFVAEPPPSTAKPPDAAHELANILEVSMKANPGQSLSWHVERFCSEGRAVPDQTVQLIAELGRPRTEEERWELSRLLARSGEGWSVKGIRASTCFGGGNLGIAHARAYGVLVVGQPKALQELALFLDHDNVAVRLAAARQLAARHGDIVRPDPDASAAEELRQRLLLAARTDPPARSVFQSVNGRYVMRLDLTAELQAAAAAALVDAELPSGLHEGLLRKVLAHDDAALVALAIERWATLAVEAELSNAGNDVRPAVAKAAARTLERLRARK